MEIVYYYYYDLFASRNAYKITEHINIVCRQKRTTDFSCTSISGGGQLVTIILRNVVPSMF